MTRRIAIRTWLTQLTIIVDDYHAYSIMMHRLSPRIVTYWRTNLYTTRYLVRAACKILGSLTLRDWSTEDHKRILSILLSHSIAKTYERERRKENP